MAKKKTKKTKKVTKTSKLAPQTAFEAGLDAEQKLADTLCDQYLKVGVEVDAIDDAFVGAFRGLAHRMLTIFKKDFVLECVEEMSQLVEDSKKEHVCDDCKKTHGTEVPEVTQEMKNKFH